MFEQIKALREKTGAGMIDVKKALEEAGGDMEKATDILRKKGAAKAAKRAGREASEGIIIASVNDEGNEGYMVEVNSETDFVSRNEQFQDFAKKIFAIVKNEKPNNREELLKLTFADTTVQAKLEELTGSIGEKLDIKNVAVLKSDHGVVASYIHASGRIGVLIAMSGVEKDSEIAHDLAMQVAASNPKCLTPAEVAPEEIEREKDVYREQLKNEGKPEAMIEKIIAGKLGKFYEEVCLVKQIYIKDDKKTVEQVLQAAGENVSIEKFVRFSL
ncbi:MAG: translation elongation factor Ts [bacterium]|nr:translation elongation factor Ts [bacterium]